MSLAAYSDQQDASDPVECDCGRPKQIGAECCSRCGYLDGSMVVETRIIGALRLNSWLTLNEIGNISGCGGSAMQRHAKTMFESGRLIRQWREGVGKETTGRCQYGGTMRMVAGTHGSWEYALSMRRAK
jgi:hypothetical protein